MPKFDLKSIDRQALLMRKAAAKSFARNSEGLDGTYDKTHSHHLLYQASLQLSYGEDVVSFNVAVTNHVLINDVLVLDDPYLVATLGAKIVEQTYYCYLDPTNPDRVIRNLSVAKHFGTFFTPPDLAEVMATWAHSTAREILIDPCLGSGSLLCAALLLDHGHQYRKLIGVELDSQLSAWAEMIVRRVADLTNFSGEIAIHSGDGLRYLIELDNEPNRDQMCLIMNPPYGRLRLTRDRLTNNETALSLSGADLECAVEEITRTLEDYALALKTEHRIFSDESGVLEWSRLFFRAAAEQVRAGLSAVIISPDAWLSGRESLPLRRYLIENRLLHDVALIEEGEKKFSTVNQATAISLLTAIPSEGIRIYRWPNVQAEDHWVAYSQLCMNPDDHMRIPKTSGIYWDIFQRLSQYPRFKSIDWLTNARGELDQTIHKSLLSLQQTSIRLVRGEHINRYTFDHESSQSKPSYVLEQAYFGTFNGKPKASAMTQPRIAGRQCSYAKQNRRLMFALVPNGVVLGNSCNYLTVDSSETEEGANRMFLILGLANSAVLDWYFRIENSNNHVANYEIDNFPFPVNRRWFQLIAFLACWLADSKTKLIVKRRNIEALLEAAVALAYDLDPESELRSILAEASFDDEDMAVNYAVQLKRGVRLAVPRPGSIFFNHEDPTLSELDRLIISYVPEGGNWQSIPECVPSARIKQIREMSAERGVVRTTYYGRLRRDQPAYTINTYFNRPGNGTHIHPVQNRTLTSREAARLQGFPDHYIFTGSEGAIRDQIGNAIPPPLAKAVGKKFIQTAVSSFAVDMFCGAGGLSLGLEEAGYQSICAIDNNQDALNTYCFNRKSDFEPSSLRDGNTAVYCRDLHDRTVFEETCRLIEEYLAGRQLDIIAGGPPCQGFSHAGFRLSNDRRNDLASIYLHFAERLRPRIFLLENVEGLVSFRKGQVLRDILKTLNEIGYRVANPVWKLHAEEYGAPQMRRRIFVVATIDDGLDLSPPLPTHQRCLGRREKAGTQDLPFSSLPKPLTVADALSGLSLP